MKKTTFSILFGISLIVISACSKPGDYDFSSMENLATSVAMQAKKEGISEEKVQALMLNLTMNSDLMDKAMKGGLSEENMEKEMLKSLKKRMSGKTLSELSKSEK